MRRAAPSTAPGGQPVGPAIPVADPVLPARPDAPPVGPGRAVGAGPRPPAERPARREPPRRPWRFGIRAKIASVILLCMVPVLLLGVFFYHDRNQERRTLVLRAQEDVARGVASDLEAMFANAVHTERAAGAAVTSQPYPVTGIVALFAAIRANDPVFLRLALALPDGRIEASDPPSAPHASVAGAAAFRLVADGAGWAVGPPQTVRGRQAVEVAARIGGAERLEAVVDGILDLGRLPVTLPSAVASDIDVVIVDQSGQTVLDLRPGSRPRPALRALPAVATALAGRTAWINGVRDPGTGTVLTGAAVPMTSLGWAAVAVQPESTALEPARRQAAVELLWLMAFAGLGVALAWVLGAELSAPIVALARGARAVGRGELGHRVGLRRRDELGELGGAFDEMSARLERIVGEMDALQSVSDAALSTVRLNELLSALVDRIVGALGVDGGAVWLVDDMTNELVLPAEFGAAWAGERRRLHPGEGLAGRTAAVARTVVVSDPQALAALDPALPAQGVAAALSVPLRVRRPVSGVVVIGVVQVFSRRPREFRPSEVRLLERFADPVALAVDHARAYEQQQEIAGIIQQALVPTPSVRLPGIWFEGRYQPSREVGGDFFAVFPLAGGRVGVAIADVSGKGIPAATLSARTRYLLEAFAIDVRGPDDVLARLNSVLTEDGRDGTFVSLYYGVLDPAAGTLRFASAGHLPPLLFRAGAATPEPLRAPGVLLGVARDARYAAREVAVGPGDLLVLYTDGITEARGPAGELFGEGRLASLVGARTEAPPTEIAKEVAEAVARWAGQTPRDDQALAVARMLSGDGEASPPALPA